MELIEPEPEPDPGVEQVAGELADTMTAALIRPQAGQLVDLRHTQRTGHQRFADTAANLASSERRSNSNRWNSASNPDGPNPTS